MKVKFIFFGLFFLSYVLYSQTKEIQLDAIYERGTYALKEPSGFNFMKDGLHYSQSVGSKIMKYNIKTGISESVLFDSKSDLNGILYNKIESYKFNFDESSVLLETEPSQIYRYSKSGVYYVYNLNSKKLTNLYFSKKIMYPSFNPKGDKVAFVYENNLYIQNLTDNKIDQITKDGAINSIINGASDWIYEEEFSVTRAFEWSPEGDQIVFLKFDESEVEDFKLEYYTGQVFPEDYTFKYPKVGEKNARLSVWNYNVMKRKLKPIKIGIREDDYIPRIQWTQENDKVCITWLNRSQNYLKLILVNTKTSSFKTLLEERNKYYIEIQENLRFLKNGNFLWTSEQDGFNHIYFYDSNGSLIRKLSNGTNEVAEVYGLDKREVTVFVQFAENRGLRRQIYKLSLENGAKTNMTRTEGTHQLLASLGMQNFLLSSSTISSPPMYRIVDSNGIEQIVLENNFEIQDKLKEFGTSKVDITSIRNRTNVDLNTIIIKPNTFDVNKKYPVLMFCYGGPGSQKVLDKWDSFGFFWWFQMLAQKNYIVCIVDNRGTGGRGQEFKKMTYLQLGKLETEDQIDVARYLAKQRYIDSSRMGIFGKSYGAYIASLCLLKGNDVFKAAIAIAPVTNWKWYSSVYTERYMRNYKENQNGYEENSPINFADQLKGNLLLVHGLTDDNVHFQNTVEMASALIKNQKQFDTYFYPNQNHDLFGQKVKFHLFTKMTSFVLEKI
ncbi:MAG: S9 family peptidase [Saprospiraceae bacterium]|nr:S9 family peptidase [Saprospiraceae bacterium]